jgi:hypothetical protein
MSDELSYYWADATPDDFRKIADAIEQYGAADTLGELQDGWRVRGSVIEHDDGAPVQAAIKAELADLSAAHDHRWLAPAAMTLARGLDNPEAEPYYAEHAAELVKALVHLSGGDHSPDYTPRLKLIRGGDDASA